MAGTSAVMVALAAFCWGLSGGLAGLLIAGGWDPFVVSLYRGAVGLLFVGLWLGLRRGRSGLDSPWLWFWSVVAGLGVAGNFSFYFMSIARGSVAIAATLMYCAPVFVFLLSFALRMERSTMGKWIAIMLVMTGVVLLTRVHEVGPGAVAADSVLAGLLSALCYVLFIFGFKYASRHGSPQAILTIAFSVLVVVLLLPGDTGQLLAASVSPDWPLFIALGVLGAGVSFILYVIGLRDTAPAVASIVAMVEPVTAALFGLLILGERLMVSQVSGMVLILITVTALSVSSGSGKERRRE